jgi:hypothetical protein
MLVLSISEGSEEGVRQQTIFGKRSSIRRGRSAIEIQRFTEDETDEDVSDILGADEDVLARPESDDSSDRSTLMLNSKLSNNS